MRLSIRGCGAVELWRLWRFILGTRATNKSRWRVVIGLDDQMVTTSEREHMMDLPIFVDQGNGRLDDLGFRRQIQYPDLEKDPGGMSRWGK